ncbi:Type I Iterative PKS [Metarhizium acridum]|uniref:Type I Iterative PKS n=1 Tax=Metarhizium acridum TaxID=92637 RepID=UPI001C6D1AB2|nr:Type I Iterative PKS [Metarhizium acridum]
MAPHRENTSPRGLGSRVRPETSRERVEAIAVIGFSINFPQQVATSDALWQLMLEKRSTATRIPKTRMNVDAMYHPGVHRRGQISVNRGHFLDDDLAGFDAPFFAASKEDAEVMDPQQRLLIECTYRALENAGLPMEKVSGTRTSVYSGVFSNDWQNLQCKDGEQCKTTTALGIQPCFNANRVSWFFNFTGNSANIDTACSSSLVCLDIGCRGLQCGDEDMSIVSGCNVILSPDNMHSLTNLNMLSPNGECYSFDHRGNGYSRGEGFGVLVLKRVSDAIRDGDTIRGIIRSTGCNQDGRTSSITLPNPILQERLIRDTYNKAGLSMEPTRFFEAHGTGTSAGDPIESKALGSAFRQVRTADDPLWVGAIKSNIGHLEGASGIAGVVKAMLILERGVIPPNTNFEKINPTIDAEFLNIQFPLDTMPWPVTGIRRASVNSFGNAGTNAHVVLDDVYHYLESNGLSAPHLTVRDPPSKSELELNAVNLLGLMHRFSHSDHTKRLERPKLLVISANDEKGVERQAKAFADYFSKLSDPLDPSFLDHLAYTLDVRRSSLAWKSSAVVSSFGDLENIDKTISAATKSISTPSLGFVFTGQGAQWAGMGRELMVFPAFEQSLQRSEGILSVLGCSWRLREELTKNPNPRINTPEFAQPCCTALQIALSDLLVSFDIYPTAVVGHSSGEIGAAYCAGALSLESALKLAYYRGCSSGLLSTETAGHKGGMMSVGLSKEAVQPYIDEITNRFGVSRLTIACVNSPKNVTISGDVNQLDAMKSVLDEKKTFARKLVVDHAYHSPDMLRAADAYRKAIQGLKPGISPPNQVAMISSMSGKRVEAKDLLDSEYWVANMLSPVLFLDAMDTLLSISSQRVRNKLDLSHRKHFKVDALLEVGPHSALRAPINDILTTRRISQIGYSSLLIRKNPATTSALNAVGDLKCLGYPVSMMAVNNLKAKPWEHYMSLPNLPEYIFDHSQKYWDESRLCANYRLGREGKLDLLGQQVSDWNRFEARWRNFLRVSEMSWIEDHSVNRVLLYPGAGMIVMAVEAANQLTKASDGVVGFDISDVSFKRPLNVSRDSVGVETQFVMHLTAESAKPLDERSQFRVFSWADDDWKECCNGFIRARYEQVANEIDNGKEQTKELESFVQQALSMEQECVIPLDIGTFYSGLSQSGLGLGPSFHRVTEAFYDDKLRVRGKVSLFEWPQHEFPEIHVIHPTTLDGILHMGIAGHTRGKVTARTMIPTFIRNLFISKQGLSFPGATEVDQNSWLEMHQNGADVHGFALNSSKDELLVHFQGMKLTTVADQNGNAAIQTDQTRHIPYHVEHKPEPDLLSPEAVMSVCQRDLPPSQTPFERYVDLITHKNGSLRILEAGTNNPEWTARFLKALTVYAQHTGKIMHPRYLSFTLGTSPSQDPESCKKQFQDFQDINFVPFDTKRDPCEQGIDGLYDMIIAPDAVRGDETVLGNFHGILAPCGRLCLLDFSESSTYGHASSKCPAAKELSRKSDHLEMRLELEAPGSTENTKSVARIYRHIPEAEKQTQKVSIFLTLDPVSTLQTATAVALTSYWKRKGIREIRTGTLEEAIDSEQRNTAIFVILLELDRPFLYSLTRPAYGQLKTLLQSTNNVLWPTFAGGSNAGHPGYALIHGLSRVLRNEYASLSITVVAFDAKDALSEGQIGALTQLLYAKHIEPNPFILDVEYLEMGETLQIPRLVPATKVMHEIHRNAKERNSGEVLVGDAPPLSLTIQSVGVLDGLYFEEDQAYQLPLEADEIEVQNHAIGLNFKDYLTAMGRMPHGVMGQECAGVVTLAGSETCFKAGDRVVMTAPSTFKTLARGKVAARIPDDMTFAHAAAIPAQFVTAWQVIHRLARLEQGETILIHTAASGTGQAAIQLAKSLGAIVYATVGSAEKKRLLIDAYQVPEEHIFYSRDTSFEKGIQRVTNGRGVDVVINTLVGDGLLASLKCVAPHGRFVEIGEKKLVSNTTIHLSGLRENVTFIVFDASAWLKERFTLARRDLSKIMDLFAQGKLHSALPLHICDISEVGGVFKRIHRGDSIGKFVFEVNPESQVQATISTKPSFYMDSNATFVIAGGLGGIGRATARWMADRGAKNLILVSRFGVRTDSAQKLVDELQSKGVRVETPACDVTDLEGMRETFGKLMPEMPPIKGALQMSVIARVGSAYFSLVPSWLADRPICRTASLTT